MSPQAPPLREGSLGSLVTIMKTVSPLSVTSATICQETPQPIALKKGDGHNFLYVMVCSDNSFRPSN